MASCMWVLSIVSLFVFICCVFVLVSLATTTDSLMTRQAEVWTTASLPAAAAAAAAACD